jgi:hypothetical protein
VNEHTNQQVAKSIAAIILALGKEGIGKDRHNKQQGYAFRGIDDVYNALSPLLAEHQLVIVPRMLERQVWERESKGGSALFYVVVTAEFDFISAIDGSMVTARTFGEGMDSADKATNKAMSAAYKYAAFQTFAIPTESVAVDSERDSHEVQGAGSTRAGQSRAGGAHPTQQKDGPEQAPPTRPSAPAQQPGPQQAAAPKQQPVQGSQPQGPRKRPTPSGDMEIDRLKFDELSETIKGAKDESTLKVAFLDAYQFAGDIDDDRVAKPWQMEATKLKDDRKKTLGIG